VENCALYAQFEPSYTECVEGCCVEELQLCFRIVVFEDTLRRIAVQFGVDDSRKTLHSVISALASEGAISGVTAKRCRVGAGVRTKATHAQWDEFEVGDVEATIAATCELVLSKLERWM